MTINAEEIEPLLSQRWPEIRLLRPPSTLTGGFWAQMWRLQVTGQPVGIPSELVLRIAPTAEMGAKEIAVHAAVAAQGYATPAIRLVGPACDDSRWSVMDFAPGVPLLAGLDGLAALRRAPLILRHLPVQLASTMAALHRLEPEPVTAAVRDAVPTAAWSIDELLDHLEAGAEAVDRPDVARAVSRLAARRPAHAAQVICHGDLHPINVLADGQRLTVLDWTATACADPRYDVAFTALLLGNPPLALPAPLSPVLGAACRLLTKRFLRAYATANPAVSLSGIEWFTAVHAARILIEYSGQQRNHGPDGGGHPWRLLTPASAAALGTASGIEVRG